MSPQASCGPTGGVLAAPPPAASPAPPVGRHKRQRSITLEVKVLQDKRSKYEQGILKLSGAARLAEEQYKRVIHGNRCSLCQQARGHEGAAAVAAERMKRTFDLCEKSVGKYVLKHRQTIAELAMLTGSRDACKDHMHSDEWCSFEFKRGKIATLREQKAQSLTNQECVVCGSSVSNFAEFLQAVDRQICGLEAELHVHHAV